MSAPIDKATGHTLAASILWLASSPVPHAALEAATSPPAQQSAEQPADQSGQISEVVVTATEPRYVAPTRRDQIGRIWAPVYINQQGPFRLVLDSGASHSGINHRVAEVLGLPPDASRQVLLLGVTGAAAVATVQVDSMTVGDLAFGASQLPIVTDALGGADGILGTDGMSGRRIVVDFRHDRITIQRSHGERAAAGFRTVPFKLIRGNLLAVDASVGGIRTTAIIDTGGEITIANLALRRALDRRHAPPKTRRDDIEGVTTDIQQGDASHTPPLEIISAQHDSAVEIRYPDVTFGDMRIFEHWHLAAEPAMLVGMDALGLLDTLVIDYRRQELQIRTRDSP